MSRLRQHLDLLVFNSALDPRDETAVVLSPRHDMMRANFQDAIDHFKTSGVAVRAASHARSEIELYSGLKIRFMYPDEKALRGHSFNCVIKDSAL
jgi:hypothetical protein